VSKDFKLIRTEAEIHKMLEDYLLRFGFIQISLSPNAIEEIEILVELAEQNASILSLDLFGGNNN
jgi:hypothetical protein